MAVVDTQNVCSLKERYNSVIKMDHLFHNFDSAEFEKKKQPRAVTEHWNDNLSTKF